MTSPDPYHKICGMYRNVAGLQWTIGRVEPHRIHGLTGRSRLPSDSRKAEPPSAIAAVRR